METTTNYTDIIQEKSHDRKFILQMIQSKVLIAVTFELILLHKNTAILVSSTGQSPYCTNDTLVNTFWAAPS